MREKIEDELENKKEITEVIKEEEKIEAEETKKTDPSKALKSWFNKKVEEKKKPEEEKAEVAKPVISGNKKIKKPINWRKFRFIFIHGLALLVLIASIGANVCLYKKYKAFKNKPAETICVAQDTSKIDQEKIEKLTMQVEKLVSLVDIKESTPNVEGASTDSVATQAENKPSVIKVAIYNGTTTVGLAKEMGITLKAKLAEAEVVVLDNAKHSNYTKTTVMAISGKVAEAQKVAQAIGGQFSLFPLDENKPDADVLVVVGK